MVSNTNITRKNPNAITDLLKQYKKMAEQEIAVGFPRGTTDTYPDGEQVLDVAIANCYGTPEIPQRDFMSLAQKGIQSSTKAIMAQIGKQGNIQNPTLVDEKKLTALQNAAGMAAQEAIREAIIELDTPPNAPGTLHPSVGGTNSRGKKSTNPLIDTGHMKDVVTWVIRPRTKK